MTEHSNLQRPSPAAVAETIAALGALFGDRLQTGRALREQHAHTTTWLAPQLPDAVIYPASTEEVQQIVQVCAAHAVPVIGFGAGTSLEGHVNAPFGGISVDFRDMAAILDVHAEDLDCRVQPGVTRKQLNQHLRDTGLFFPVDPGADASLGGMASTRASGTNAVRYGTMKDLVLGLTAVLPDGQIVTTARRARKSSAGYDLTRLMVGAEGTLGLITELTLRLHGIPEAISSAVCSFSSVQDVCDAVIATTQMGIPVARMEFLDALTVRAVNGYSKLDLPEMPLLLLEFHGSEASVAEQAAAFGEIAEEFGATGFRWTTDAEERGRLWQARHDAYWATHSLRPGLQSMSTDVCVPVSALASCVTQARERAESLGMVAPMLGHVGDGNFHILLQIDKDDAEEVAQAQAFMSWLSELAISLDGTCTGEHGIGQGKAKYLASELGDPAVAMMRAIKRAVDPKGIMNPGKIFDVIAADAD
ncbi:FAD-binding oxidoreductase [Pseudoruegeria sp. SK021]|uniref:FAD-binding oxidoreductase n=1 Tax=Pseudoruegeria sp. SK021 TaxID=1933035 RepID=UPI000A21CEE3|nr:FAD-linked oxidase C-terminal domain-containing protein [Pseudoruegeria sp. SK021]OSP55731.1 FAD-binding oxidoreductase [Pseudoruegeria sp. SK021]